MEEENQLAGRSRCGALGPSTVRSLWKRSRKEGPRQRQVSMRSFARSLAANTSDPNSTIAQTWMKNKGMIA